MVSQSGWRFWPAFWGVFGAVSALLAAWGTYSGLGWAWYLALLMTPLAIHPVNYAISYYREIPPEAGFKNPTPRQFTVAKWVSYGLWALFGLGVLAQNFWEYVPSPSVMSLLSWGISLQELRVAHIVRGMRRREAERAEAEAAEAAEPVSEESSRSS